MTGLQAIADRVEIEALRGEFTDAAMMRHRARLASLFTPGGVLRMPSIPVGLAGQEEIRAGGGRLQGQWEFFVQNTHPGMIQLDGDTATGRAYMQELARTRDGRQGLNYAIYHDRYQRTADGWKFTERVYEVRYSTPARWRARRPTLPRRPLTRRPGTCLRGRTTVTSSHRSRRPRTPGSGRRRVPGDMDPRPSRTADTGAGCC